MFKLTHARNTLALIGIAGLFATTAGTALAQDNKQAKDSQWQRNHPRREQVNTRLANQNSRIKEEVKEGDMSHAKAARLHRADQQIRQEERDMAQQNGGHLTRQEQHTVNQQETAVSRRIGQ